MPAKAQTSTSAKAANQQSLPPALYGLLTKTFGHRRLRPDQDSVMRRVLAGQSTLAVMPTGAGKSLCYQLPALLLPGRTLVVSPLIALMKDQRDRLQALGVDAVQLNSSLGADETRAAEEAVANGTARVVFVTPERLANAEFLQLVQQRPTSMLVVDEAHCISQWGHDFRPAFLDIANAAKQIGSPTVLALTATATPDVAKDIAGQLGIPADGVINSGSYRPNLHYGVELVTRQDEKLARALACVASQQGSGIVYVATVKMAVLVHAALLEAGESVGLYHGRLAAAQRSAVQDAFMHNTLRVMVATNAFGLGIDKPDVRFVLHYQMPAGLDAYYQESGRAGRDGQDAACTLLYLHGDKAVQQFFLANRYPGAQEVQRVYRLLHAAPAAAEAGAAWTVQTLADAADSARSKVAVVVNLLVQQRVLARNRQGALRLLREGLGDTTLQALSTVYQERRDEDRNLLEKMVAYAQSGFCRWKLLLQHLAAAPDGFTQCGHCDNCRRAAAHREPAVAEQQGDAVPPQIVLPDQQPKPATPAFSEGQAVRVKRYGTGRVTAADALSVMVTFANGEHRCFMPDYVTALRSTKRRPNEPPSLPVD